MVAGVLAHAGYQMGMELWPPRAANPKGFFEDREVNEINEELLTSANASEARTLTQRILRRPARRPVFDGRGWLARVPLDAAPQLTPRALVPRIQAQVAREPYCLKDPRFSYTLACWQPFLRDPLYICVFREPNRTALSIVAECETADYLHDVSCAYSDAIEIWMLMYRHILERHISRGEWLFVHYEQALRGEAFDRLEEALGARLDRSFVDPKLKRTPAEGVVAPQAAQIYDRLCELARYSE
jgi:hypothetical protein